MEREAYAAKSLQSCPTLCDPTDGSPTGSPVPGILQARTLEWVAISFFNAQFQLWHQWLRQAAGVWEMWTIVSQAPLSKGFSRHEYWSGLLFPSPGDLPNPGIKFVTTSTTWEAQVLGYEWKSFSRNQLDIVLEK